VSELTADKLRKILKYDPATGLFEWLQPSPGRKLGAPIGKVVGDWYVQLMIGGKNYKGHRLAWLYMTGNWPQQEIDHKDRDRRNNAWANLRLVSHKQNAENVAVRRHSSSQVKGVYWDKVRRKWEAYITHNKRRKHLGRFVLLSDAILARSKAEQKLFTHAP